MVGELGRLPTVTSIGLSGLQQGDVARLLDQLGASLDPAAAVSDTGGNPLLIRELARGGAGGSSSVEALLARRYALLSQADLEVLDAAAAIGVRFDIDLVAWVVGVPVGELLEAIDRLEAAGLVEAVPGQPGQLTFVHALFQRARYDRLSTARRLQLHQGVAVVLEGRLGLSERVLPELARHAAIAAPLGAGRRAVHLCVAAAAMAERSLALAEAASYYRWALDLVPQLSGDAEPKLLRSLSIRLGEVLNGIGHPDARAVLLGAAASARADGDVSALAEIASAMMRYGGLRDPGGDREFVSIAEGALAWMGDTRTALRARTLAALSEEVSFTDPDRGLMLCAPSP